MIAFWPLGVVQAFVVEQPALLHDSFILTKTNNGLFVCRLAEFRMLKLPPKLVVKFILSWNERDDHQCGTKPLLLAFQDPHSDSHAPINPLFLFQLQLYCKFNLNPV
jgi:hypothetical protein